ncbi:NOF-FB transposable element, partial [Clarias magur]
MPKKAAVEKDAILKVLCSSKEAILINGNIATPAANVWTELSEQLEYKISAKALYTFDKLNRHNVWSVIGFSDPKTNEDTDSETDSLSPGLKVSHAFQLEVPFEKWKEFVPEDIQYKDKYSPTQKREYTVLKPGSWTHIVNDQIWKRVKSNCTFVFKRAKVHPSATNNYIVINGYCKECRGHLNMKCKREPVINSPMVFKCHISNTDDSKHTGTSKRFLAGQLRVQVAEELCEGRKEAHVWRASQATKLMDFGDPEPSHLPNLATLRKAKQQRKDLELADKNAILSLQLLKHSVPHSGSIRDIGLDKFFCHYWSQTQMHVYKTLSKKPHQTMCFDATGSVVRKLARPNGSSGHIFLYQGVLTGHNSSSVPVVQMLSERHDTNAITQWLTEWIRAGAPIPKEAVSDFSLALLGALVKAFTPHPDLKSYINECFGVLLGKQSAKLPSCFVRVDVAHCIKMICQWDSLKNKTHRIKDFFVRSIVQLLKSQSLNHAKELIRAITIVALSEAEGNDSSGAPLTSEMCKNYLKAQIAEESVFIPEEVEGEKLEEANLCNEILTDLRQWVTEICDESKSLAMADGDRDNMHYLPDIIPHIIRL